MPRASSRNAGSRSKNGRAKPKVPLVRTFGLDKREFGSLRVKWNRGMDRLKKKEQLTVGNEADMHKMIEKLSLERLMAIAMDDVADIPAKKFEDKNMALEYFLQRCTKFPSWAVLTTLEDSDMRWAEEEELARRDRGLMGRREDDEEGGESGDEIDPEEDSFVRTRSVSPRIGGRGEKRRVSEMLSRLANEAEEEEEGTEDDGLELFELMQKAFSR